MKLGTQATEAAGIIYGEREQTYGNPGQNFERIAAIWSVIFGVEVTVEQVGWAMVGLKMAREVHRSKDDNLVDALGYLMLLDRIKDEAKG